MSLIANILVRVVESVHVDIGGIKREVHPNSCECNSLVELVHVQDVSASMEPLLGFWRDNAASFMEALQKMLPNVNMAITSHVDKPVPYSGVGFGDFDCGRYLSDYCYRKETYGGFVNGDALVRGIEGLPTGSGGGDPPNNQFDAILNSIQDPSMQWSASTGIKLISLVTNSISHGYIPDSDVRTGGGFWPDSEWLEGKDLEVALKRWTDSYHEQKKVLESANDPFESGLWETIDQLQYSRSCRGSVQKDYVDIGALLSEKIEISENQANRWADVSAKCGPRDVYKYLGINNGSDISKHPGGFVGNGDCRITEYANQHDVQNALYNQKIGVHVFVPDRIPNVEMKYDDHFRKMYGYSEFHGEEVMNFYKEALGSFFTGGTVVDLSNGLENWLFQYLLSLRDSVERACGCPSVNDKPTILSIYGDSGEKGDFVTGYLNGVYIYGSKPEWLGPEYLVKMSIDRSKWVPVTPWVGPDSPYPRRNYWIYEDRHVREVGDVVEYRAAIFERDHIQGLVATQKVKFIDWRLQIRIEYVTDIHGNKSNSVTQSFDGIYIYGTVKHLQENQNLSIRVDDNWIDIPLNTSGNKISWNFWDDTPRFEGDEIEYVAAVYDGDRVVARTSRKVLFHKSVNSIMYLGYDRDTGVSDDHITSKTEGLTLRCKTSDALEDQKVKWRILGEAMDWRQAEYDNTMGVYLIKDDMKKENMDIVVYQSAVFTSDDTLVDGRLYSHVVRIDTSIIGVSVVPTGVEGASSGVWETNTNNNFTIIGTLTESIGIDEAVHVSKDGLVWMEAYITNIDRTEWKFTEPGPILGGTYNYIFRVMNTDLNVGQSITQQIHVKDTSGVGETTTKISTSSALDIYIYINGVVPDEGLVGDFVVNEFAESLEIFGGWVGELPESAVIRFTLNNNDLGEAVLHNDGQTWGISITEFSGINSVAKVTGAAYVNGIRISNITTTWIQYKSIPLGEINAITVDTGDKNDFVTSDMNGILITAKLFGSMDSTTSVKMTMGDVELHGESRIIAHGVEWDFIDPTYRIAGDEQEYKFSVYHDDKIVDQSVETVQFKYGNNFVYFDSVSTKNGDSEVFVTNLSSSITVKGRLSDRINHPPVFVAWRQSTGGPWKNVDYNGETNEWQFTDSEKYNSNSVVTYEVACLHRDDRESVRSSLIYRRPVMIDTSVKSSIISIDDIDNRSDFKGCNRKRMVSGSVSPPLRMYENVFVSTDGGQTLMPATFDVANRKWKFLDAVSCPSGSTVEYTALIKDDVGGISHRVKRAARIVECADGEGANGADDIEKSDIHIYHDKISDMDGDQSKTGVVSVTGTLKFEGFCSKKLENGLKMKALVNMGGWRPVHTFWDTGLQRWEFVFDEEGREAGSMNTVKVAIFNQKDVQVSDEVLSFFVVESV